MHDSVNDRGRSVTEADARNVGASIIVTRPVALICEQDLQASILAAGLYEQGLSVVSLRLNEIFGLG
jgi:hypothetical protein